MSTVLKRFSLVGVAVALLATGCGTGPAKAGSAAIVGDSVIDLSFVQDQVRHEIATDEKMGEAHRAGKSDKTSRDVISAEVLRRLTELAAQRAGITVDEALVYNAVQDEGGAAQMAQGNWANPDSVTPLMRAAYLRIELAKKYLAKSELTVDYFYTLSGKEAREKVKQVQADPSKMDQFAQESPRTSEGESTGAKDVKISAVESPAYSGKAIWAAKPGTVVAFQVDRANSTWMVMLVKARNDNAAANKLVDRDFERMDPELLGGFGVRITQYLTSDVKVEINPRYGVWNPAMPAIMPKLERDTGDFFAEVRQSKS